CPSHALRATRICTLSLHDALPISGAFLAAAVGFSPAFLEELAIEAALAIPEFRLGAAEAAVAREHREAGLLVPLHRCACVERRRSLATKILEAIPLLRALIVKAFGEQPLIEEGQSRTIVMNGPPEKRNGASQIVEIRRFPISEKIHHNSGHHLRDRRTTRNVDDGGRDILVVDELAQGIVNSARSGRVGRGCRDPPISGASADRNDERRSFCCL